MSHEIDLALTDVASDHAAMEALCCACVLADAPIPFEMAIAAEGAMHNPALLNPAAAMFAVAATLEPLCSKGLAEMDHGTGTYSIPAEVRERVVAGMSPEDRSAWQARAIHALSLAVPDASPDTPPLAGLAPHINVCLSLVREGFASPDANRALHQYGFSLHFAGQHLDAAELLEAALSVDVALKPEGHPDIAADLEGIASVLAAAGEHERAVEYYERCAELFETLWTEGNQALIPVLAGLALSLRELGREEEAVATAKRAGDLFEQHFGDLPVSPDGAVADCLKLAGR